MKNNYVGAWAGYNDDFVHIWERVSTEERIHRKLKKPYYFYVPADDGDYTSVFGEKLEKLVFEDQEEFDRACRQFSNKHESDISPLFKILMNDYYNKPNPILNFAFIDIETDIKTEVIDWDLSKKIKVRNKIK